MRRSPIRRRRPLPRRRLAPRWTREQWDEATIRLYFRQHGRCAWCHRDLGNNAVRHHRLRRREGGDRYANLVLLHDACHKHVHLHPAAARDLGVTCPTGTDPADWPWHDAEGVAWLLDDAGAARRLDSPPETGV